MSTMNNHQLTCPQGGVTQEEIIRLLEETQGAYGEVCSWEEVLNGHPATWAGHDSHLREVSRNWPSAVFALDIQGDNGLDVLREYHHNGASYRVRLQTPPFDASRLRLENGEHLDDNPWNEAPEPWHHAGSVLRGANTQSILNGVVWKLTEQDSSSCYLEDEDVDALAPNLKGIIMERIHALESPVCCHVRSEIELVERQALGLLPPDERQAIRKACRDGNPAR